MKFDRSCLSIYYQVLTISLLCISQIPPFPPSPSLPLNPILYPFLWVDVSSLLTHFPPHPLQTFLHLTIKWLKKIYIYIHTHTYIYTYIMYIYWRRQWHPTPVLLPGKSHGRRSLVSCSPWGCKESDTTVQLHFHSSLSCSGEGNGNPLQCSCLENPRDGGAWWAAVYGVTKESDTTDWACSQVYLCQTSSPSASHPAYPTSCPHIYSLCPHLYSGPGSRFICAIFLNSAYMC